MRVLTTDQMRRIDQRAIEDLGIPSLVLMENAAIGVADALGRSFPEVLRVAILCGPGNNGGDGLAVARHLFARGYSVTIAILAASGSLGNDCGVQLDIVQRIGLEVAFLATESDVKGWFDSHEESDLMVDALFGTGLSRPLEGLQELAVSQMLASRAPVLAVDVPSGLDTDLPELIGPHCPAELTVTFAAPKLAHLLGPASISVGELVVADLGLPKRLFDEEQPRIEYLSLAEAKALRPVRSREGHKGMFGRLLIIGGSLGMAGAPALAAQAAIRSGAGLVTAAVPTTCFATVEAASLESLTVRLPTKSNGTIAPDTLTQLGLADEFDAVTIGPGLGIDPETAETIRQLIQQIDVPMVIDADGLNALSNRLPELKSRSAFSVLTPHPGEMARLLGEPVARTHSERLDSVRKAARISGSVVLLKGSRTLIADPDANVAICPTGNHGLASGGTGDVLSGVLGNLLAQGLRPWDAARLACYVHGLAADLYISKDSPESLSATALIESLGTAFKVLDE